MKEGKTFNGTNTLDHLLFKAARQADRIVVDMISQTDMTYIISMIKLSFEKNANLDEVMLLKGSRIISIDKRRLERIFIFFAKK